MSSGQASGRRLPPKPSITVYRSGDLLRTAPDLAISNVHDSEQIRLAAQRADAVRDKFRQEHPSNAPEVTGSGEIADAQKHKRRVKMNRDSAKASRLRYHAYVSALESQLVHLERVNKRLLGHFEGVGWTSAGSPALLDVPVGGIAELSSGPHVPDVSIANTSLSQPPQIIEETEIANASGSGLGLASTTGVTPPAVEAPLANAANGAGAGIADVMLETAATAGLAKAEDVVADVSAVTTNVATTKADMPDLSFSNFLLPSFVAADPEFCGSLTNEFLHIADEQIDCAVELQNVVNELPDNH